MAHFAHIDESGIVDNVIVADQDFIDSGAVGDKTKWIQTSYNTHRGEHRQGRTPIRKNYAGKGFTYDPQMDAFIPPKPYPSWTINNDTGDWDPPVDRPSNPTRPIHWDEGNQEWVEEEG
jgi:hypothetical protein